VPHDRGCEAHSDGKILIDSRCFFIFFLLIPYQLNA
jgi:hypothetical protein